MDKLVEEMVEIIENEFSGNLCIKYDSSDNREVIDVRFYQTTPFTVLKIRNKLQKSPLGINCFTGGDICLENDFEWEGNDKTYELIHLHMYLVPEMFEDNPEPITVFNGKRYE